MNSTSLLPFTLLLLAACGGSSSTGAGSTTGAGGSSTSSTAGAGGATTAATSTTGTTGTGGSATASTTGAGGSGTTTGAGGAASCLPTASSTLPGVTIEMPSPTCVFTLAEVQAGVEFPFAIKVAADVPGVVSHPQDAGQCGAPGVGGLIVFGKIEGGGQSYCLCDVGKCGGPKGPPATLKMGSYPGTYAWDGRNWSGPSDFGNPEGLPFPAGDYTLELSAVGTVQGSSGEQPFTVSATLPIHLVN